MKENYGSTIVLYKNDRRKDVFLVFRSDYPIWVTTGGGIEPGETSRKAALREAFEETGFKVKIVRKVGIYYKRKKNIVYKSHLFEGRVLSGKFKPEFPGCKGGWFSVNKLPLSMIDRTKVKILDCLKYKNKRFKKEDKSLMLRNNFHLLILHPLGVSKYIFKQVVHR